MLLFHLLPSRRRRLTMRDLFLVQAYLRTYAGQRLDTDIIQIRSRQYSLLNAEPHLLLIKRVGDRNGSWKSKRSGRNSHGILITVSF